jgi:hypothetical protein
MPQVLDEQESDSLAPRIAVRTAWSLPAASVYRASAGVSGSVEWTTRERFGQRRSPRCPPIVAHGTSRNRHVSGEAARALIPCSHSLHWCESPVARNSQAAAMLADSFVLIDDDAVARVEVATSRPTSPRRPLSRAPDLGSSAGGMARPFAS